MKVEVRLVLPVLAAVLMLGAAPSFAERNAVFTGAGVVGCGEFVNNRSALLNGDGYYSQWAIGYMVAYNQFGSGAQVKIPDQSSIILYAEKHCRQNPLEKYLNAVSALIRELGGSAPALRLEKIGNGS